MNFFFMIGLFPIFLSAQHAENNCDDISSIYEYCQYKILDCEKEMKRTKKTSIYSIYQAKREAYVDIREKVAKY